MIYSTFLEIVIKLIQYVLLNSINGTFMFTSHIFVKNLEQRDIKAYSHISVCYQIIHNAIK
jgi:hypothetical protein